MSGNDPQRPPTPGKKGPEDGDRNGSNGRSSGTGGQFQSGNDGGPHSGGPISYEDIMRFYEVGRLCGCGSRCGI
jgi:hypothetical protein